MTKQTMLNTWKNIRVVPDLSPLPRKKKVVRAKSVRFVLEENMYYGDENRLPKLVAEKKGKKVLRSASASWPRYAMADNTVNQLNILQ